MLRKLFKPKPRLDAADPNHRIAALADLADSEQEAFAQCLLNDPERSVRLAALQRLTQTDALLEGLGHGDIADPVAARLLAILDDSTPDTVRHHPAVLRAALATAETPAKAIDLAARLEDPGARAAAIAGNPRANVRIAVAETIWDQAALVELEKFARNRDRSLHRIVRHRLTLLKTAIADREREAAQTETILAAAASLASDAPHYQARRDAIERDWAHHLRSVAATDQQLARFGIAARDIAAINGRLPVRCPPPEVVTTESAVDYGPLLAAAETLYESIATAITAGLTDAVVADLKGAMETLTGQCADAANATPPAEALAELQKSMASVTARWHIAERALALGAKANAILRRNVPNHDQSEPGTLATAGREIHRQRSATDRLLARYAWPDELPKPAELTALGQRQRELGEAAKRYTANVAALTAQVAAALAELRDCLERGAAQDAVVVDRRLRELVKQLPDDEAPSFNAALADAGARLRELRAWRAYAETPKRQDLCRQVEQLATEPLEVNAQAETIKELRAQWNQLGAIDTRRDRELKQRFDQAAQRAFEPCRAHFKARAEQRTFNLEQRQTIVAALASYLADNDWEGADWRGVETVLREARAEWRRYHPVDRNAGRELSARFEELASRIHALLTEQRNQNLERKEAIVTAAVAIRESSDRATDKAVAMKALQQRWKAVGPAPRGPDKRLWTRFRAECDIVFEARNAVQDRHSQRRQAIAKTEALLAELERRVDVDPALNRNTVADYEGRLGDLESLPKELQRRVKSALENADRAAVSRQLRNAERVAPENPGRVAPEDPGRAAPENTERAASENPKRAASENPERAASENPKRAAPENPERAASENPERAASENPGRAAPENPGRA